MALAFHAFIAVISGVDAENEAQDQDAANATIIIEARGEDNGIPLVENALSDDLQRKSNILSSLQ